MKKIFDIHAHILPAVDDGSPDMETSIRLLKEEVSEGVTDIILTPHYRLDMFLTPATTVQKVFNEFSEEVNKNDIKVNLYLGQELHYAPQMLSLINEKKALTLNNTNYILLEFSWHIKPENPVEIIKEYIDNGIIPIVVHYERFPYKTIDDVIKMKKAGALFQVNAYSLMGVEREERMFFAEDMLKNNLIDFVSADYHKGKRLELTNAYNKVVDLAGEETADKLFYQNAKEIFKR